MHADRISADGNKIAVTVGGAHIFEAPYGLGLQLDSDHVVYLKTWQVEAQNKPYMGQVGTNVVLDRAYFNVKKSKYSNNEFSFMLKLIDSILQGLGNVVRTCTSCSLCSRISTYLARLLVSDNAKASIR